MELTFLVILTKNKRLSIISCKKLIEREIAMFNSSEFEKLMKSVNEVALWFPDEVVFIGGIAVHIHSIAKC